MKILLYIFLQQGGLDPEKLSTPTFFRCPIPAVVDYSLNKYGWCEAVKI